jgi:hypothetical protein
LRLRHGVVTPDKCHQRSQEAKELAGGTQDFWEQDLWERGLLFKIADQWQLLAADSLAAHRAVKESRAAPKLVLVGKPTLG